MHSLIILGHLFKHDLIQFKREFWSKLFDTASLLFTNLMVFGYFMPHYGLSKSYGPFMLISAIASFGFFDTVGKVATLISDIEGDRKISYTLTLPLSSRLVFIYIALYWALNSALVTILLFPMGKLILFNEFDLSKISFLKLIPIYLSINIFYGFFSLWLTSMLRNMSDIGQLWVRIINPLIMFGAYFYAWDAIYQFSPIMAYITLLNPVTYVMEGLRSAALGPAGFLPFHISLSLLWCFILLCGWHSIHRLQKRLDCVK